MNLPTQAQNKYRVKLKVQQNYSSTFTMYVCVLFLYLPFSQFYTWTAYNTMKCCFGAKLSKYKVIQ